MATLLGTWCPVDTHTNRYPHYRYMQARLRHSLRFGICTAYMYSVFSKIMSNAWQSDACPSVASAHRVMCTLWQSLSHLLSKLTMGTCNKKTTYLSIGAWSLQINILAHGRRVLLVPPVGVGRAFKRHANETQYAQKPSTHTKASRAVSHHYYFRLLWSLCQVMQRLIYESTTNSMDPAPPF